MAKPKPGQIYREVKIRHGNIDDLITIYKTSYTKIVQTIQDETDAGKINKARVMARINKELSSLGVDVNDWVQKEIPQYYQDGANIALQDIRAGGFDVNRAANTAIINKQAIAALTDETSMAFAQGITGISRNANRLLSDAVKQQLNFTIAEGRLTGEALKTVADSVKQRLIDEGLSALTDKAGRNWTFDRYAEMLVRTKVVESRNQGLTNTMLSNGYDLVQVSDHNSDHKACADWEGEILSLTGKTPGYDTVGDAQAQGLFHPNCEHAINVINQKLAEKTQAYDNPYNHLDPEAKAQADNNFANRNDAVNTP